MPFLKIAVVAGAVGLLICHGGCAAPPVEKISRPPQKQASAKTPEPGKPSAATVEQTETKKVRPIRKKNVSRKKHTPPAVFHEKEPGGEPNSQGPRPPVEVSDGSAEAPSSPRTIFYYDYYPEAEVYFDVDRHLYFYRDGGKWTMSVALPSVFRNDIGRSVRIEMESANPFERHRDHLKSYPARNEGRF